MMKTNVILVSIPDADCIADRLDLRVLMARALKIEARMEKGVNLEDEQRRYQILCDRMEYLGNLISGTKKIESVNLGDNYLELLLLMKKKFPEETKQAGVMSNFCPASFVEKQIALFEGLAKKTGLLEHEEIQKKIKFYRMAAKQNWNVLELQELTADEETDGSVSVDNLREKFLSLPMSDGITSTQDSNSFMALRNQMNRVIAEVNKGISTGVNFSDLSHNVITEILNEFVFGAGKPMYLPVVYADGTKARPFPIHCLKLPERGKVINLPGPVINVGQLSGRHQEMDPKMNIYFFRNQEISTGKTAAEIDGVAYQEAKKIFEGKGFIELPITKLGSSRPW
ncbi:MAG: hypothetical protein ACD_61C00305G0004 [uncultured bacterium]|nr:MAG: hypothetical protein ACD_61C00305G0004 [uncultured bacterium]